MHLTLVLESNADRSSLFEDYLRNPGLLADIGTHFRHVIEEDGVEDFSLDLKAGRATGDFVEADAPWQVAFAPYETTARLHRKSGSLDLFLKSNLGENVKGGSDHGLANMVTGEALALEDENPSTHACEEPPTVDPAGPPPTTIASNSTETPP